MTNLEALIALYESLGGHAEDLPAEATNADVIEAIAALEKTK